MGLYGEEVVLVKIFCLFLKELKKIKKKKYKVVIVMYYIGSDWLRF